MNSLFVHSTIPWPVKFGTAGREGGSRYTKTQVNIPLIRDRKNAEKSRAMAESDVSFLRYIHESIWPAAIAVSYDHNPHRVYTNTNEVPLVWSWHGNF